MVPNSIIFDRRAVRVFEIHVGSPCLRCDHARHRLSTRTRENKFEIFISRYWVEFAHKEDVLRQSHINGREGRQPSQRAACMVEI